VAKSQDVLVKVSWLFCVREFYSAASVIVMPVNGLSVVSRPIKAGLQSLLRST
jgi:hypothetical protein